MQATPAEQWLGRYWLGPRIGSGGMGSVNLAMIAGAAGFERLVAIKRLHSHYLESSELRLRFQDEVRLSANIVHPNVVQVLDVLEHNDELVFAMEYVHGDTLRALMTDAVEPLPVDVVVGIVVPMLLGLEAAHTACDQRGRPLDIVHRDVSPHNVLLSAKGDVKILDFGIAKAAMGAHISEPGTVAGKVGYASPEQVMAEALDARADVFSAGIVLWEALLGTRLFRTENGTDVATLKNVLSMEIEPPSRYRADLPPGLDDVVLRALKRERGERYGSARELAAALCAVCAPAPPHVVGSFFAHVCGARLAVRDEQLFGFQERYRSVARGAGPREAPVFLEREAPAEDKTEVGTAWQTRPVLPPVRTAPPAQALAPPRAPSRAMGALWAVVFAMGALGAGAGLLHQRSRSTGGVPTRAVSSVGRSEGHGDSGVPRAAPDASGASSSAARVSQSLPASPSSAGSAEPKGPAPTNALAPRSTRGSAQSRRKTSSTSAVVAPAHRDPCAVPTYVDAQGIRHFKAECL